MATFKARRCSNCWHCRTVRDLPGYVQCNQGHFNYAARLYGSPGPYLRLQGRYLEGLAKTCPDFDNREDEPVTPS